VERAQADLAAESHRCDAWSLQGRRAIATAEARLVAAQVLVPDHADTPAAPTGSPAGLAAVVQQTERELEADLAALHTARRRARQRAAEDARRAQERAAHRMAIIKFAVIGGAVVVAILALAVALS
jgi:hypothetical protein